MYILKAFASNSSLTNNMVGVVAPIGELSTKSLTYAREKGVYANPDDPNILLTTFTTADNSTQVLLPKLFEDHVQEVVSWMYKLATTSTNTMDGESLLDQMLTDFANRVTDVTCGPIVSDGVNICPAWLQWKCLLPNAGANMLKVWFVDQNFLAEYDDYEIVVVSPFEDLNDFFKPGYDVINQINKITPASALLLVQKAKGLNPETVINVQTYTYQNPANPTQKADVNWYLLIYGSMGDNLDAINTAVAKHVLANSTRTKEDWKKIFPDIFKRTEFVIFPLWDQYAIPQRLIESGIYSPIVNFNRINTLVKPYLVDYPSSHVDAKLCVMSHPYKSLQLAVIAGPENRGNLFDIRQLFADYIDVSSTSIDFNRMSKETRAWTEVIYDLIMVAETMTKYTTLPLGIYRIERDGIIFASKAVNGVNFLVVSKANMPTVITGE